jgi:hypothetical protein
MKKTTVFILIVVLSIAVYSVGFKRGDNRSLDPAGISNISTLDAQLPAISASVI